MDTSRAEERSMEFTNLFLEIPTLLITWLQSQEWQNIPTSDKGLAWLK